MRLGSNPLKSATIAPLSRVVVLVITHLPEMESDYHRGRMEVMRRSLESLVANINLRPFESIIWDNGSCSEAVSRLVNLHPSRMIISRNIGKTNALKSVMRMLPPGTILAYGDDDIEYSPNWLAPQIEILETYPNVGTVTGYPVRITGTWGEETINRHTGGVDSLNDLHLDTPDGAFYFEKSRFLPDEWERDYCDSVGRDYEQYKAITWGLQDTRITYKGVQAYAMSQHCQFVCYPERVEPLIEWTDRAMQDEIPFDEAVDAAGYLRLATTERLCRHLGNMLERA